MIYDVIYVFTHDFVSFDMEILRMILMQLQLQLQLQLTGLVRDCIFMVDDKTSKRKKKPH